MNRYLAMTDEKWTYQQCETRKFGAGVRALLIAPNFISARNSGKLQRHKAWRDFIASLKLFLSVAISGPWRDRRSSQWFCSESSPSNADRARKVHRWRKFFTSVIRATNRRWRVWEWESAVFRTLTPIGFRRIYANYPTDLTSQRTIQSISISPDALLWALFASKYSSLHICSYMCAYMWSTLQFWFSNTVLEWLMSPLMRARISGWIRQNYVIIPGRLDLYGTSTR